MPSDSDSGGGPEPGGVSPEELLSAILHISPDDAETVRERTPGTRPEKIRQEGPSAEFGEEGESD